MRNLAFCLAAALITCLTVSCSDNKEDPPGECLAGQTECAGMCVDLHADRLHCGACEQACEDDETCYLGTCVSCQNECTSGQARCAMDGTAAVEPCDDVDPDPCLEWGPAQACAAGEHCEQGACLPGCQDECPAAGTLECSGDGVRECGEFDTVDDCLEWSAIDPCPAGQACDPLTTTCRPPCGDHCEPFSIVLLPDTQYYTSKQADDANNTYYKQMQWIIDNRDAHSIQFVIHLGDITNNNTVAQWTIADQAHAMLDAAGVPYSMVPGNHDYLSTGNFSRGDTLYGDYFGPGRFAARPWYGGSMGANNLNNYTFFEVGPYRFLVLSLEYAPRKQTLCWADELIAAHPNHRVILATHCYLTHGGNHSSGCPNSAYDVPGANGASVWSELARRHNNIFLVVSGHVGDSEYVLAQGNSDNPVHQMLVDYQFEVPCPAADSTACSDHCHSSGYTGNGWLRLLEFSPANNRVTASTLSVEQGNAAVFPAGVPVFFCSALNTQGEDHYDQDPQATDHHFGFDYPLTSADAYQREDLGSRAFNDLTVNSAGGGDQLVPQVAMSSNGLFVVAWQDNSSASDGAGNHDILVRGFDPGGCERFADRVVHSDPAGHQQTPSVAADQDGNFVVAWADDRDGNGSFQIRARGFWADGSERFADRVVNSQPAGQQLNPVVAMAPDGRFGVAWEDDPENDGDYQIMLRGFTADGSEHFADLQVNENAAGQHRSPALAADAQGRLVVVWQDDSDGNGSHQIHGRAFTAAGSEWLPRFTANTQAAGQQLNPSVGADAQGGFVVAWEDDGDANGSYQILARGFSADGTERIGEWIVNSQAAGQQLKPALSMAADGTFVVAWEDDADGNGTFQVLSRGFWSDGSEWFADRTINRDGDGQQLAPGAGVDDASTLVFVWEDDMDGNGFFQILAKGLDVSGL